MEKSKKCFECACFIPEKSKDLKGNGECTKFGWFVNGRKTACEFANIKSDLIKDVKT